MDSHYYDELAPFYKLIYPDWNTSVKRQARILDGIIKEFFGEGAKSILDAACGVGTQSLGLAELGYQVSASDISAVEIEEARLVADKRKLDINFRVADMRSVWDNGGKQNDIVIACDNSIPHLLSNDDILQAFRQFYLCTKDDGGCLISVRDYAVIERIENGPKIYPRIVHQTENLRQVLFDVWDFSGDQYEITTYIVEDDGTDMPKTRCIRGGRYYCVELSTLERLLRLAGFSRVSIIRERFFQPLLVAEK